MKFHLKNKVLAWVVAVWASGVAAQEDCQARINKMKTVGDIQAALTCVQGQITSESERVRDHAEKTKNQLLLQTVDQLELVTTNLRHVELKESTNGTWKPIPESNDARACFLTAVRMPARGLCQISYQGTLKRWAFNISDPGSSGFTCTASCIWLEIRSKKTEQ